ncbi:MAG: DUF4920 domain-containing protein [Balneolia bacterium]|nr:DUF4920 domain-containing protein [Balneolia bacterium]
MNRLLLSALFLTLVFTLAACSSETEGPAPAPDAETAELSHFGESFTPADYIYVVDMLPLVTEEESAPMQVRGEIVEVCQSKGCWLTLASESDIMVRVTFKDYEFFVPKDIAGREVILEGIAWLDEVSVAHQQHYAEDAGESEEEIEAITEPSMSYYFEATGVILL